MSKDIQSTSNVAPNENVSVHENEELERLRKELAEANEKLAHYEQPVDEKESKASSEITARIIEIEKKRAAQTKTLLIPEDLNADSQQTYHCSINGKIFSIPKGVEVEVPLAVYENYMEYYEAQKRAVKALSKANKTKEIGG